jgi:hypothetical protein
MVCAGCDHAHVDGKDKPCPCGCHGFIRSVAAFATEGCMNPECPECIAEGRHAAPGNVS